MQEMTLNFNNKVKIFEKEHHDNCTRCNHTFINGETAHLGYIINSDLAYVCNNCSHILTKTIVRRRWCQREYIIPPSGAMLWRYMDLSKYLSLLFSKSLFFTSLSNFSDLYEGAKGLKRNKGEWDDFYFSFMKSAIANPPEGQECNKTEYEIEEDAKKVVASMERSGVFIRGCTFANCWHNNVVESEAMWNLYSNNRHDAIAVQTTFENLFLALDRNPQIDIGQVNYIDFNKRFASLNNCQWYKRKSFAHENEIRAVIISPDNAGKKGIYVPVDLKQLIQRVYVSPYSSKWFKEIVQDLNYKYKLEAMVEQSILIEPPFY